MSVGEGDIGVCVWFGAPIMHRISERYLTLTIACSLWTCTFNELVWDCLLWGFVVKVACIGQCEEFGVSVSL